MNNLEVQKLLDECATDLGRVKGIIDGLGMASNVAPYLTKYSLIRACGAIEQSFKSIVADHCSRRGKKQVKQFIGRRVRDSSMNPSYDKICGLLKDFDDDWLKNFKAAIDISPDKSAWKTSLQSLVDARNEFSHGGNPSTSIGDVTKYYTHSRQIIEVLDAHVI